MDLLCTVCSRWQVPLCQSSFILLLFLWPLTCWLLILWSPYGPGKAIPLPVTAAEAWSVETEDCTYKFSSRQCGATWSKVLIRKWSLVCIEPQYHFACLCYYWYQSLSKGGSVPCASHCVASTTLATWVLYVHWKTLTGAKSCTAESLFGNYLPATAVSITSTVLLFWCSHEVGINFKLQGEQAAALLSCSYTQM